MDLVAGTAGTATNVSGGGTVSATTITASTEFVGPGTGLTGTAASFNVGGTAGSLSTTYTAGRILYGAGSGVPTTVSTLFYDSANGRLGIGVTNPQVLLTAVGTCTLGTGAGTTTAGYHTGMVNIIGGGTRALLRIENNNSVGSPGIIFGEGGGFTEDTQPTIKKVQGTNNLAIMCGGNVGIGTTTPAYKLDVAGDINFSGAITQAGTLLPTSQWTTLNSNIYYLSNVSIGSSGNPGLNRLHVTGNIATTSNINFPQGALLSGQPSAVDWSIQNSGGALNFTRNSTTSFLSGGTLQLSQYGMVGIQLGNPTALLHIGANTSNTTDMFHIQAYNGTSIFKVQATGAVTAGGGVLAPVTWRQGGDSSNWSTAGTSNFAVSTGVQIQTGSSAGGTVTFPVPFTNPPVVILGGKSTTVSYISATTNTSFSLAGPAANWMAIGI